MTFKALSRHVKDRIVIGNGGRLPGAGLLVAGLTDCERGAVTASAGPARAGNCGAGGRCLLE